ncbi:zinc-alpha-2-glycoprotein-like isoform X2 [Phascolarctos cinereus]|uniref:Zinc-alpha-2-glycoprotein-like isoform X2 n=1 Tax=Phascolarctos cinereus TaxID=38626 RepID=A0A6P5LFJ5_PHACI|nr:zinc-alpha-2-glycoprotein-like isoform X2 [Phascolarctos cinereus]
MASEKRKKSLFTWMLILGCFAARNTQADYHIHDFHFTAIGTRSSLLSLIVISSVDNVQLCYYSKQNHQVVMKKPWMYQALGAKEIEQKQKKLISLEKSFIWAFKNLIKNETNIEKNHTLQVFVDCTMDQDIQVSNHFQFALDGEDFCQMDEQLGHWVAMKPEAQRFKPLWDNAFWNRLVKHYIQEDCVDSMKKILQYSSMRENVPPQVTVFRHDAPDGRVTLFCRATGFYPRSIVLHWERDGTLGVWGQESSSGTLPNADATFYLQVTLELPPGDPGTGYTCVVEHSELETPAMFPGMSSHLEGPLPSPPEIPLQ